MMAAISFGSGLSGILSNLIQAIIVVIDIRNGNSKGDGFAGVMIFYLIAAFFLLISSLLYFVERKNKYSLYYTKIQETHNRKKGTVNLLPLLKDVL
jgi:hypothetical protein